MVQRGETVCACARPTQIRHIAEKIQRKDLEKAIIHLNFEHTESGKGRGEKVSITSLAINKNEFAVNFEGSILDGE